MKKLIAILAAALVTTSAAAQIKVGVTLAATGVRQRRWAYPKRTSSRFFHGRLPEHRSSSSC